ncbi:translation initiation factor IF-2 [Desulfobaculum xiamenense]|uniref:Translation initiation factor IF-2 n=1 Tax=Desulfobaculum xiamenense TaxID=995050 RepID=A0A846QQQ6_9BACT|nr:translation initiation factor IF-2 [Desulfobaculum xiamenense]NJB66989.1 translation initiation factor IF-2 [Desulfobaculum xiamenense]
MADKLRVKDISTELGVTNKDLIQACREIGIPVKSHMSTLSTEEADTLRSKIREASASTEVVRKEVQPGMVVRRRRKPVKKTESARVPEKVSETPEDITAAPANADFEPEVAAVAEQPAVEPEPKPAPKDAEEAKPVTKTAPKVRIIKPKTVTTPEPEVIAEEKKPVAEAVIVPEAVKAEPPVATEAPAAPKAQEAPIKSEEKPAEIEIEVRKTSHETAKQPEEAAQAAEQDKAESDDDRRAKRKKKVKKKEVPVAPKVRIISRPDPNAAPAAPAPAAETRRPAPGGRPAGERSYGDRPSGERTYGDRPSGDRGYGDRPSGDRSYGDRPAGGRPAGARPAGPRPTGGRPGPTGGRPGPAGGAPRPAGPRPAGGRPGAPSFTPDSEVPGGGEARRRKKKDKRVVDFSRKVNEDQQGFQKTGRKKGKGRGMEQMVQPANTQPLKAAKRKVKMEEAMRLADFAKQLGVKAQALIKVLFGLGVMATINQSIDFETAVLVAAEFGYEVEKVGFSENDYLLPEHEDTPETLKSRAPVVTIMGHVDHGKTSLLDAIRKSKITSGEAGGITQHIGAYDVETDRGKVVFLDTPGHEAFTAMRARGAQVTDIVILVVAADDGVMEQTREAINHSKAAGVPIIVAVNKMDKPEANPDRVMRELADHGLVPEDWGGETIFCYVSAKTGENLDQLLEMVLLQAEVLELKANPDKRAVGHIVEARLDKGRGAVATVLIQAGTLRQGDNFVCGTHNGRVRAMHNDKGKKVKEAGPATPVEVQGFDGVPEAGDEFICVEDEKVARRIAGDRQIKQRERALARESKVTLESFLASRPEAESQTLNLVLKADVQGSLEAITEALRKLSTDKIKVDIVHSGAGAITESDILLAAASQAIIIGFNVRPTAKIKEVAEQESVEIRFYDIIYKLVGEIKDAMAGMLAPVISEKYLGQAEVRDTFSIPKVGTVAGCFVVDGELRRNAGIRLLRDGVVIYTGKMNSLKRFKDDVKEVRKGYECGGGLENFNDIKVGDIIEAFEVVETAATLD